MICILYLPLHYVLAFRIYSVSEGSPWHAFAVKTQLCKYVELSRLSRIFCEKDFLGLLVLTAWQAAVLGPLMNPCLFSMIPSPLFHSCDVTPSSTDRDVFYI